MKLTPTEEILYGHYPKYCVKCGKKLTKKRFFALIEMGNNPLHWFCVKCAEEEIKRKQGIYEDGKLIVVDDLGERITSYIDPSQLNYYNENS